MHLTGNQFREIRDALLYAFPTRDALQEMVRFELDENLDAIAGGVNQRVVIFNLVTWAEQNERVYALLAGASRQLPGNPALQQLVRSWPPGLPLDAELTPIPLPARSNNPVGPTSIDIFLSYSRIDGDTMHQVLDLLREAGLSVWTDEGLDPGSQNWEDAITEAVTQARSMVVVLSPNANASKWVKREIGLAEARGQRVFPLLVAGDVTTSIPLRLMDAQWVDGRNNLQKAIEQVLLPALRRYFMSPKLQPVLSAAATDAFAVAPAAQLYTVSAPKADTTRKTPRWQRHLLPAGIMIVIVVAAGGSYAINRFLSPAQQLVSTPLATRTLGRLAAVPTLLSTSLPTPSVAERYPPELTATPNAEATAVSLSTEVEQPVVQAQNPLPTVIPTPKISASLSGGAFPLGSLSVTIPEACDVVAFSIKASDEVVGGGRTGEKRLVAPGIYDVVLDLALSNESHLVRKGITIEDGKETLIDFGSEIGMLDLNLSLPEVKGASWAYMIYDQDGWWQEVWPYHDARRTLCFKPGVYTLKLDPVGCDISGGDCTQYGIMGSSEVTPIEVEIRAQETTNITSDVWARTLGFLFFASKDAVRFSAKIFRSASGEQMQNVGELQSGQLYWMLPGKYNIVMTDPFANLHYDNVEIKVGEKTQLNLPEVSLP